MILINNGKGLSSIRSVIIQVFNKIGQLDNRVAGIRVV